MNAKIEAIDPETGEITSSASLPVLSEGGMVGTLVKAEMDTQIATAKQYPRSLKNAIDDIMSLATLDEQTAAECMFALPRGGKPIRGPSIRLAEIIAQAWRNNRSDARVIQIDRVNKVIVAEGTFHDLETNSATRSVVQRRISDKRGRIYNDDLIVVTGNAACSIAKRNAILAGVPKAVWRKAYEASEKVVAGDVKTLASRREAAIKAFATYGVKPEQVFAALDVEGVDDISLEHIPTLQGMFSALKNGETTVEEMFDPRRTGGQPFEVVNNPLKDDSAPAASTPVSPAGQAEGGEQGTGGDATPSGSSASAARAGDPAAATDEAELAVRTAYDRGKAARASGALRRALPGEYRDASHKREEAAWLAGWDGEQLPK